MFGPYSFGRSEFRTEKFTNSIQSILVDRFRANADRIAVVDAEHQLSYCDLAGVSAQNAEKILSATHGTPERIALMFDQSACFVVALTAVLRAGCAYVPLDPRRGGNWNRDIISRTECKLLLCSEAYADFTSDLGVATQIIRIRDAAPPDSGICISRPHDSLACIYSTSGTTGASKAVCDTHCNIVHNAWRYSQSLDTTPDDRLSLIQAPIFSGTQSTIFMGLICGCALYCFDVASQKLDGLSFWLRQNRVTMFHSVPSIFRTLANDGPVYDDIRLVRIEGDRATHEDLRVLRNHFRDDCVMVNGLGATECGIVRQFFITRNTAVADGDLPIGNPVPDMDVTIIDVFGHPCVAGQTGEVLVTSKYLAIGYLGDEQKTRAKFKESGDGRRSYRTGDIGYIDTNEVLWLRGRQDQQIKINGEAIDPAEIELALKELPFVAQALVSSHTDHRDVTALIAYLVPFSGQKPPLEDLQRAMAERLAAHLRPKRLIWLERLPLTIDGKVDRNSLPPPIGERPEMETRYVAPRDDTERTLAWIWQQVLGISPIGVFDDVMMLGCDSLAIVQFANRVRTELGVQIQVSSLFDRPTIAETARTIDADAAPRVVK